MRRTIEYSLPKATKTNWKQVTKSVSNLSDNQFKRTNIKEHAINKLFSNDELVDVLRELSKV